jgi:hypothetical protein
MDLLPTLSPFTVFMGIAAVGFLFLVAALIFGEIFDFFDHDPDFEIGGPGVLSSRVIAVFVTSFGAFGALGINNGLTTGAASALGVGSGLVFGGTMALLGRFLYNQQATSEVRTADLVGLQCRVTVGIPANGIGQIRCRVGEELVDKIAQSQDGAAIGENTTVRIETVLGETVVVRKL